MSALTNAELTAVLRQFKTSLIAWQIGIGIGIALFSALKFVR
jgi:hypothetical protein